MPEISIQLSPPAKETAKILLWLHGCSACGRFMKLPKRSIFMSFSLLERFLHPGYIRRKLIGAC
jgi:hypothetical protein